MFVCVLWAFLRYSHELLSMGCISISKVCVNSCSDYCVNESKLATCLGHSHAVLRHDLTKEGCWGVSSCSVTVFIFRPTLPIQRFGNLSLSALQTVLFWWDSASFLQKGLNLMKNASTYKDKFYCDLDLSRDML
jgi:hypothetical protein